jgi:hypothetical protein
MGGRMSRTCRFASVLLIISILCWLGWAGGQQNVAVTPLAAPTDPRDLVVFIANFNPSLHRIVGNREIPFGTVKFEGPASIVADSNARCFYVLDKPKNLADKIRIWRINPEGNGNIVFESYYAAGKGGPFNDPVSLGLDRQGRVLIADASTGLWRLENGHPQRLFDGKNKPLRLITAVTEHPSQGLLIGTSYQYIITGGQMLDLPHERYLTELGGNPPLFDVSGADNSTGRQVPIRIWQNQGGLFLANISTPQTRVSGLLVNQAQGGQEYETYWRTLMQVMVDSGGRIALVDCGTQKVSFESVYIGPGKNRQSDNPRITRSNILGGVFIIHPNGKLENLTFKTPEKNSGPMRHPTGIAQWSTDTYIVSDSDLYAEGINGTGGLLLLGLDGRREARWAFGYRLKPTGVAILRGAGPPATVVQSRPIRLNELAGTHIAGPITRIDKVSLERKPPADPRDLLAGIRPWAAQSPEESAKALRSLFEGARWDIDVQGSLVIAARGANPSQQGTPLVVRGKIVSQGDIATVTTSYFHPGDVQIGSVDAEIQMLQPGVLMLRLNITMYTNNERLKATFEQTMPLR